jgi:carbamoyltransferase
VGKYILGLHTGHNASACIGVDGKLLYAIQEERLCGEKNYWGYPQRAIDACLNYVGAKPSDLAAIAHGSVQVLCKYHSREDVINAYRRQDTLLGKLRQRIAVPLFIALKPDYGQDQLLGHLTKHGLHNVPRQHYDHHWSHAATAYYGLRRDPHTKYCVLTCDGDGDSKCATVRIMGGGEDREVAVTSWDNSLGALYSWTTFAMGFVPLEHEYKLMGMAPYASDKAAIEAAKMYEAYLGLDPSGLTFQRKTFRRTNDLNDCLFDDMRGRRFDYLCAGLQRWCEDLLVGWTEKSLAATGLNQVLAAGGVFMNVKANKRISEIASLTNFEAFPSCGDETLSLGAFYLHSAKLHGSAAVQPLDHFYLGDDLDDAETEKSVKECGLPYSKPDNIAAEVAKVLAAGQPVARCAGRMEFGARALGNRSILADPSNQDVVRIINQMVKKRDFWMPFAPMMMASRHQEYVRNDKELRSPYMMMTFDARENFRELIAAVHNADLTCRAQLLEPAQNPAMHDIVSAFSDLTGRGVVLNTSFNLHGFPIVRTAAEAIHVLKESGLNYLQAGPYLIRKE